MRFSAVPSGNSWKPILYSDTTKLSYWLNWRFFVCALWVLSAMAIASILIWKYEGSEEESGEEEEEEAWKPSLKTMHPAWLLVFRISAFIIFVALIVSLLIVDGAYQLYYYTQWTAVLVTIYFGLGSLLSAYGCYEYVKVNNDRIHPLPLDVEDGSAITSASVETSINPLRMKNPRSRRHLTIPKIVRFGSYLFKIIYQVNAGAILLTDFVFWFALFPYLAIKNYDISFLQVSMHSVNAIFFLCDVALNRLRFRWYRIAYFVLWTLIYVIFQWVIHTRIPIWWPYLFLDLSSAKSPMWYLGAAIAHIPCYVVFYLIIKLKHYLFLRWFRHSYYQNF